MLSSVCVMRCDVLPGCTHRPAVRGVLPEISCTVAEALKSMASDALEVLMYAGPGPGGETYVINMGMVVEFCK